MSDYIQEINNENPKSGLEKVLDKCVRIFFRSKWVIFGAALILVIILIVLTKIAFSPANNLPTKNIISIPAPKVIDLCAKFPKIQGEITCAEAKAIALAKYPGQLLSIDKTTLPYEFGKPPEIKTEDRQIWLVHIKPDNPLLIPAPPKKPESKETEEVETIGIVIDRSTKEILFLKLSFKK